MIFSNDLIVRKVKVVYNNDSTCTIVESSDQGVFPVGQNMTQGELLNRAQSNNIIVESAGASSAPSVLHG